MSSDSPCDVTLGSLLPFSPFQLANTAVKYGCPLLILESYQLEPTAEDQAKMRWLAGHEGVSFLSLKVSARIQVLYSPRWLCNTMEKQFREKVRELRRTFQPAVVLLEQHRSANWLSSFLHPSFKGMAVKRQEPAGMAVCSPSMGTVGKRSICISTKNKARQGQDTGLCSLCTGHGDTEGTRRPALQCCAG